MKAIYSLQLGGKFYIGSSSNLDKRIKEHIRMLKKNEHHSKKLQNAYNKALELPIFQIIEELDDSQDMFELEEKYIELYDSFNSGYNSTPIACGTRPEDFTQERKDKISNALKGKTAWNKGIPMSCEQKLQLKEISPLVKPIDLYSLDGELLYKFNSINDCYKTLNLDKRSVQRALNKTYSKYKDMIFEYSGNIPQLDNISKSTGNNTQYNVFVENDSEKFIFKNLVETSKFLYKDSELSTKYLTKLIRNAINNNTLINGYKIFK